MLETIKGTDRRRWSGSRHGSHRACLKGQQRRRSSAKPFTFCFKQIVFQPVWVMKDSQARWHHIPPIILFKSRKEVWALGKSAIKSHCSYAGLGALSFSNPKTLHCCSLKTSFFLPTITVVRFRLPLHKIINATKRKWFTIPTLLGDGIVIQNTMANIINLLLKAFESSRALCKLTTSL